MEAMSVLSVIAVNYNSSALLKDCFSSLVSATENIKTEFIVIDSDSREDEVNNLRTLEGDNVRIILKKENVGYPRAVNEGLKNANGDFILITNPDVFYTHDSIKNLLNVLKKFPNCGAVGPRTWWDKGMTFLLPLSELITPFWMFKTCLMDISSALREVILRRWIRKVQAYWLSEKPPVQDMLSGACIMTTRKVLEIVGGFDETFPLYFEDADWCLRARKAGYHLYMVPDAHIIHYYNQSAGQDVRTSQEKFDNSLNIYLRKYFKIRSYLSGNISKLLKRIFNKADNLYDYRGAITKPPVFTFEDKSKKLLLLSPVDSMIPSAGSIFEGDLFKISEELWNFLNNGRYFMRAFEMKHLSSCGAWSWDKIG